MDIKRTLLASSALAIAAMIHTPVMAQGVPVIDTAQISQDAAQSAREVAELVRQFQQLQTQYDKLEEQRTLLEQQFDSITGVTDLSSVSSRDFTRLSSSLDMLSYSLDAGNGSVGAIPTAAAQAMERRSLSLGFTDGLLQEFSNSDIPARRVLAERGSAGLATAGIGENGYNLANDLAEDAEGLREELGQQETLKESVDFNSALLIALLQVQIESMRISSATALSVGTSNATEAADHAARINYARGQN